MSPTECERLLGFPVGWTHPGEEHCDEDTPHLRRNAIGNTSAVPVTIRLLYALTQALTVPGSGAFPQWSSSVLTAPYHHDCLDDLIPLVHETARDFHDLTSDFLNLLPKDWAPGPIGPDPGAGGRRNRSQRSAATGLQMGSHLSRNGLPLLIPEDEQSPQDHVLQALELEHPFSISPEIPLDLKFAALRSTENCRAEAVLRGNKLLRLVHLANLLELTEAQIRSRLNSAVRVASGSLRLAFLIAITSILNWPDWQLTSLFTRGFKVAGLVEPSNVYPKVKPALAASLNTILDPSDADHWNQSVAASSLPSDLDKEVFATAQEQVEKGLLSKPMPKTAVDKTFGRGGWRAIRRRGTLQNDKVRGIDNARASKTNFAAFLQDTIVTTPHDVAIQVLAWLFSGREGSHRFRSLKSLFVSLGADDLADAYHGIPNALCQLGPCIMAIMNPQLGKIEFDISYAHLFGLSAAVVNFNRLPEILTAAARRIGAAM